MLGIYLSIWVWGEWFILLFEMLDLTTGDLPPSVRSLQIVGSYYLFVISVESDSPCPTAFVSTNWSSTCASAEG